ncbi:MAG: DUF6508 domain-containing protein [bacterium]|nr:DUF6508 domain-containing protein [bacterium]
MSEQDISTKQAIIDKYSTDAKRLIPYLTWFEAKKGADVSGIYEGEPGMKSMPVTTYDSTLLEFVKLAKSTVFMDKNYPYVYTRNHIRSHEDELRLIENARLTDIQELVGILSKYVMEGMRRSSSWVDAVDAGIFLAILRKLKLFFERT